MLLTFSGLDGAGKTTQIRLAIDYLEARGYRVQPLAMYDHVSTAAVVRRSLRNMFARLRGVRSPVPRAPGSGKQTGRSYRLDKNRRDLLTTVFRQIVYLADLARFYAVRLYHERWQGRVIVLDRYFYDSIANITAPHGWRAWYTRLFLAVTPKPDLAIFLDIPVGTAFQRKPEYEPEYMALRAELYRHVFGSSGACTIPVAPHDSIEMVHARVRGRLDALLQRKADVHHVIS